MANGILKNYRHPIIFFSCAILISWSLWFTAVFISNLEPAQHFYLTLESILSYVGIFVPAITGLIMVFKNPVLKQDFLSNKLFNFKKIKLFYLLTAALLPPASILLAQAISLFFGYSTDQFHLVTNLLNTFALLPIWLIFITAPISEEFGWRTYGIDSLRARFNLFTTSIIFALLWATWHVPLVFIKGYILNNMAASGSIYIVNYFVSFFCAVILLNWLYFKTGRNLLIIILFHFSLDLFAELFHTHPDSKIIQTIILTVLAIIIIIRDRDFFFKLNYEETA